MLRRILSAALAAGLLAGVLVSVLQAALTTPLILQAEVYEQAMPAHGHGGGNQAQAHAHPAPSGTDWGEVAARTGLTVAANLVTGVGFALLVVAGFTLSGRAVEEREGLLWGLAGFAAFTLAPALGLAPEVPGTYAADLADRQAWWSFAAAGAAAALWLLAFGRAPWRFPVALAVAALPHILGAPEPAAFGGGVPPELAGQFAARSIGVGALFWCALGWLAGGFFRRLSPQTGP
ncbi:MAG TPA: CbtA family protein [Azospirillum sp.]